MTRELERDARVQLGASEAAFLEQNRVTREIQNGLLKSINSENTVQDADS